MWARQTKTNTNSSTATELVATYQYIPKILFVSFLSKQGYNIETNYIM